MENLPLADESSREEIRRCVEAIACLRREEARGQCEALTTSCGLSEVPESRASEGEDEEEARRAECRVEFLLCQISPEIGDCQERLVECAEKGPSSPPPSRREGVEDATPPNTTVRPGEPGAETEPPSSPTRGTTTTPSTTTATAATTRRTVLLPQGGGEAMVGSSNDGSGEGDGGDFDESDGGQQRPALPQKSGDGAVAASGGESELDDAVNVATTARTVTSAVTNKEGAFTPPYVTTTEASAAGDSGEEKGDGDSSTADSDTPATTTTQLPSTVPDESGTETAAAFDGKVDMSTYDARPRGTLNLALCAEASRCKGSSNTCQQAQTGCAAGLDVSGLRPAVRRKLSECLAEDILCHINAVGVCRSIFASCADIVIPDGVKVSAKPIGSSVGSTSESGTIIQVLGLSAYLLANFFVPFFAGSAAVDPFLQLLGISGGGDGSNGSPLANVTHNVLQSLDEVFQGIQVEEGGVAGVQEGAGAGGEVSTGGVHFAVDNETIPIFQDVHVILDDSGKVNGTAVVVTVGGAPVTVDLANPAIIYDPGMIY